MLDQLPLPPTFFLIHAAREREVRESQSWNGTIHSNLSNAVHAAGGPLWSSSREILCEKHQRRMLEMTLNEA